MPFEPFPARGGIEIVRVEANPGVAVPIGRDGKEVAGAERNAYLPPRRDTLIRAFIDVPEGWVPRELEARLHLTGGGVDEVLTTTMKVEFDSRDSDLGSTFYWGVPADLVRPGLKYSISLWEAGPGQEEAPEGSVPPQAPHSGAGFVGIEGDAKMEMRVVLVPVDYAFGGCDKAVDGEAWRQTFTDALTQENPVESVDLTVHAPYTVDYDMKDYGGLSRLVSEMSQLRSSEGADPNVYYYALFDNCGACIGAGGQISSGCVVGLAADITGPDQGDAYARAAAGQIKGKPEETFVHEIGHTQGRRHIECSGAGTQAAGTDPSYPYEDGVINVWGFGIRDFGLRHPTSTYDYMSYCGKVWASDWQWNATYQRIRTLSGWSGQGAPAPEGGLLIGAIDGDRAIWWTAPGSLADGERSATHVVDFEFADGVVPVPARVSVRPHGGTLNVVAPLPSGFDGRALEKIVMRAPGVASEVAPGAVRWLHRPPVLTAP